MAFFVYSFLGSWVGLKVGIGITGLVEIPTFNANGWDLQTRIERKTIIVWLLWLPYCCCVFSLSRHCFALVFVAYFILWENCGLQKSNNGVKWYFKFLIRFIRYTRVFDCETWYWLKFPKPLFISYNTMCLEVLLVWLDQ